jgi:hypothetical protein
MAQTAEGDNQKRLLSRGAFALLKKAQHVHERHGLQDPTSLRH